MAFWAGWPCESFCRTPECMENLNGQINSCCWLHNGTNHTIAGSCEELMVPASSRVPFKFSLPFLKNSISKDSNREEGLQTYYQPSAKLPLNLTASLKVACKHFCSTARKGCTGAESTEETFISPTYCCWAVSFPDNCFPLCVYLPHYTLVESIC